MVANLAVFKFYSRVLVVTSNATQNTEKKTCKIVGFILSGSLIRIKPLLYCIQAQRPRLNRIHQNRGVATQALADLPAVD